MPRSQRVLGRAISAAAVAMGALLGTECPAHGQSDSVRGRGQGYWAESIRAPMGAVEVGVQGQFVQAAGLAAEGTRATDLSKEGFGLGLSAGYRVTPRVAVGVSGELDDFRPGERLANGGDARGLVARVSATYHFVPFRRIDPWLRAGAGYRLLWLTGDLPAHRELWQGFELVNLVLGVDFRSDERWAFGPFFGADVTMFGWRQLSDAGNGAIDGKRPAIFLVAGLQARLDLAGTSDTDGR